MMTSLHIPVVSAISTILIWHIRISPQCHKSVHPLLKIHARLSCDGFFFPKVSRICLVLVCRWRVKVSSRPWASWICCSTTLNHILRLNGAEAMPLLFEHILTRSKHGHLLNFFVFNLLFTFECYLLTCLVLRLVYFFVLRTKVTVFESYLVLFMCHLWTWNI